MYIFKFKIFIPLILLFIAFIIQNRTILPPLILEKQQSAINIETNFLKLVSSPLNLLTADLIWIATLMEGDLDHYKSKDLNSWMFLRFKNIMNLDPLFLQNYRFGGQYLNIIKDDLEGSSYIFEKGLERFPNDYKLITDAAFLYTFEYQNTKRAIELYEKALMFPEAPEYFKSILSKLQYSQTQDPKLAFLYLKEVYEETQKGIFKDKIRSDLYSLKALIDLECLNIKKLSTCDRKDFFGNDYIYKQGEYKSKLQTNDFKLFKRPSQP